MKGIRSDDDRSAPDEHRRFARYLHELAVVKDEDEAALVAGVLRDPDATMAQSAVVRHLDRRAARLLTEDGFTAWAHTMAEVGAGREFLARRLREWVLLRAIAVGEPWGPEEVTAGSDWFQRRAVEILSSRTALTLLSEAGRTRRVRADAGSRLRQR
ncbi:hypothetical protein ACWDR3_22190 [Streptomyces sp. NPDC001002]